jgi:hypothetical protein
MKALDLEHPELSDKPVPLTLVEAGARWNLPEETFLRWWKALPEEDRTEFIGVYGGDAVLARFVCALDQLTTMQARAQTGATLVEAYCIAANTQFDTDESKRGAMACWQHDAVQALLDRLRYRSRREAAARITTRTTLVMEKMLTQAAGEDTSIKDKSIALNSALKFLRMVTDEDIQERVERTRRGFQKAREVISVDAEYEEITPDKAQQHLKILRQVLGDDEFQKALNA